MNSRVICPCMGIVESQVVDAIRGGATSIPDLRAKLGVATKCTGCEAYLYDLLGSGRAPVAVKRSSSRLTLREIARSVYHVFRPSWLKTATCAIERDDLHTRINIANLEFPELEGSCRPVEIEVQLWDAGGKQVHAHRQHVGVNVTRSIEVADLLRRAALPTPFHGMVRILIKSEKLRSLRFYCHWHNDVSVTSTHEKYSESPIQHGYQTLTKVLSTPGYETYLAVTNLTAEPFRSKLVLLNGSDAPPFGELFIEPWGTTFRPVSELLPDHRDALRRPNAGLYLDNNRQPSMFYYFGHNRDRNTWQVQHL